MPRAYDRLADFIPLDELDAKLRVLHARVATHVDEHAFARGSHRTLLRSKPNLCARWQ